MNRVWSVALAVMALAACSAFVARADSGSMSSDAKTSTSKSAMKGDAALQEKLEGTERKAWEAFKSKDAKGMMEIMSADGWSADMMGFTPASQMASAMQDYNVDSYNLSDFKVVHLGKDAAILAYTANTSGTYKGQPAPAGPYYCTSAYVNHGGKWTCMFHQETLSMTAMPSAGMESPNK